MGKQVNGTRNDKPMGYMMLVQRKLASTSLDNENNLHKKADESIQGLPQGCQTLAKRMNEGGA